jgi:hypothetical protein
MLECCRLTWPRFACALLCAVCCGCGQSGGPARVAVSGQVDRAGAPTPNGTISFLPVQGGPAAITAIEAGRYRFDRKRGPPPGRHRVLVIAASSRKQQRFAADPGADLPDEELQAADSSPARWEIEVDVPDQASCEIPIRLK